MKKSRRQWLKNVIETLEAAKNELDNLYTEEEEAYKNMPYNLQDSVYGVTLYYNANDLEQASQDLEDIITNLQKITER